MKVRGWTIPDGEIEESFSTSGGPGGQHANRTESAVRLRFDIAASSLPPDVANKLKDRLGGVVEVTAAESRSQFRNRALARQRLAQKLEEALRERPRRKRTKPTRAARRRRIATKRARSEIKRRRRRPRAEDWE